MLDFVIVGSMRGPGPGRSAARGVPAVLIGQDGRGGMAAIFPGARIVVVANAGAPGGPRSGSRPLGSALAPSPQHRPLPQWREPFWSLVGREIGLAITYLPIADAVTKLGAQFIVRAHADLYRTGAVLLALPGFEPAAAGEGNGASPLIATMADAGRHILVAGTADLAAETALGLAEAERAKVTLALQGPVSAIANAATAARLSRSHQQGRIEVRLMSHLAAIGGDSVDIACAEGSASAPVRLHNDIVVICTGEGGAARSSPVHGLAAAMTSRG